MQIQGKGKEFEYRKYVDITEEKAIQKAFRKIMHDLQTWAGVDDESGEFLAKIDEEWRAVAARVFVDVEGLPGIDKIGGSVGLAEVSRDFFMRAATLSK